MGADPRLEVDYVSTGLRAGDRFLLTSDGLHDALATEELAQGMVGPEAPALLAERLIEAGRRLGARDNLSCQLLCVDSPGSADLDDRRAALDERPLPPPLSPGMELDGLTVERELHASPRSQLYRVRDGDGRTGVIKAPSVNLEDDAEALQRFALEGWLLARAGPHFPRPLTPPRPPSCQYLYLEYIDGVTLDQWAGSTRTRRWRNGCIWPISCSTGCAPCTAPMCSTTI